MPEVIARVPEGWKNEHLDVVDIKAEGEREDPHISISEKEKRSVWARLLSKIYEVHAFFCPKCSSDMHVINTMGRFSVMLHNTASILKSSTKGEGFSPIPPRRHQSPGLGIAKAESRKEIPYQVFTDHSI